MKFALIAAVAFGLGTMFTSCCCDDAKAPKLPSQPQFKELPSAPQAPTPVIYSKK